MHRKGPHQKTYRVLEASAIFLVVLNALIWPTFLLDTILQPVALEDHRELLTMPVSLPAPLVLEDLDTHDVPLPSVPETVPTPQAVVTARAVSPTSSPVPPPTTATADTSAPSRLLIPAIGVNAPIGAVGLAADGSMDVPKRPADTAWYALGPRPGEVGSAVIAGHVSWMYSAHAVFAKLHTLKPGDIITVQAGDGKSTSFVVRGIREYDAAADATEVFFSTDGKAHLNLVTCSGTWDQSERQYTERLVVFADEVVEAATPSLLDSETLSPSP